MTNISWNNILKGLGYAVIIILAIFIVWLIYKTFIKNSILSREPYEDIMIVIESQCPPGYSYQTGTCTACEVPNAVNNIDGKTCMQCNTIIGTKVDAIVDSGEGSGGTGKTLGKGCTYCTGNTVPDPNPNYGLGPGLNSNTSCVNLSVTTPSGLRNLVATSTSAASQVLHAISLSSIASSVVSQNNTPFPNTDTGNKSGGKVYTYNVNAINVTSTSAGTISTTYNNLNATEITNVIAFLRYMFQYNSDALRRYFSDLIFGGGYTAVPNALIDLANITFVNGTSRAKVSDTNFTFKPTSIEIRVPWDCGIATITKTGCSLVNNVSKEEATFTYEPRNSKNLTTDEFKSNCRAEVIVRDCTANIQNCILDQSVGKVLINPGLVSYDTATSQYVYTDQYTWSILQVGQGAGARVCEDPSPQNYSYQTSAGNMVSVNPVASEIKVNYSLGTATVNKWTKLGYLPDIYTAWPNNNQSTNPQLPPFNISNPSDYSVNPAMKDLYVLYKRPNTNSVTYSSGSSSPYTSYSLPVVSVSQSAINTKDESYTPPSTTQSPGSLQGVYGTRKTGLLMKRNIYEQISVLAADIGKPFYIADKIKFLLKQMGVVASENLINNLYFTSATQGLNGSPVYSAGVNTTITNVLAPPSYTVTSFGAGSITNNVSAISITKSGSGTIIVNRNQGYRLSTTPTIVTTAISSANLPASTTANLILYSWIAVSKTSGVIQTALIYGDTIRTSYDSGQTWLNQSTLQNYNLAATPPEYSTATASVGNWSEVCMSDDGVVQYAITSPGGYIFFSTDAGFSWRQVMNNVTGVYNFTTPTAWSCIACNGDGTRLTVAVNFGKIYSASVSFGTNSSFAIPNTGNPGVSITRRGEPTFTWSTQSNPTAGSPLALNPAWNAVSVSTDGKFQTAVILGGYLARSENFGATWTFPTSTSTVNVSSAIAGGVKNWIDVKIAPGSDATDTNNGRYQIAIESSKTTIGENPDSIGIYWSNNFGVTWNAITASFTLGDPFPYGLRSVDIDQNRQFIITTSNGNIVRGVIPVPTA